MADLVRIRSVWTGVAGAPFYTNTFFIQSGGGGVTPQVANDAMEDFWDSAKANFDNALLVQNDPEAAIVDSTTGLITGFVAVTTAPYSGTAAGDALPTATQFLLRHRTNTVVTGRRLQGRTFIPGQMEANNNVNGQVDAGYRTGLEAAWTSTVGATGAHVIFSKTKFAFGEVAVTSGWNEWAVLRSRRD